jgi:hypothetical protein
LDPDPPYRHPCQSPAPVAGYAGEHCIGTHDAYGVMVFATEGDRIARITGFPHDLATFKQLGLARCP